MTHDAWNHDRENMKSKAMNMNTTRTHSSSSQENGKVLEQTYYEDESYKHERRENGHHEMNMAMSTVNMNILILTADTGTPELRAASASPPDA